MSNETTTKWTRFMDMHSGERLKEKQQYIYIEAPQAEAVKVFFALFGHNPYQVTGTCCWSDYSIDEGELAQITGFDRGCRFDGERYVEEPTTEFRFRTNKGDPVTPLDEYLASEDVRVVRRAEFPKGWEQVEVKRQGYVWQD